MAHNPPQLAASSGDQQVVNGSGGDIVLPAPTSIAEGDIRLHALFHINNTFGSDPTSAGTGMTQIGSWIIQNPDPKFAMASAYKVATSSEGNITATAPSLSAVSLGWAGRVTGADPDSPLDTSAQAFLADATGPRDLPRVTTTVDNCLIVYVVFCVDAAIGSVSSGASTHGTFWNAGGGNTMGVFYETQATAGLTAQRTISYSGSSRVFAFTYAITPAQDTAHPVVETSRAQSGTSLGSNNSHANPSGAQAGDLVVAVVGHDNPGTTNITGSSGWTGSTQVTQGSNVVKARVFARVLDGTTGDNVLSVSGAAQDYVTVLARISGHGLTNAALPDWVDAMIGSAQAASGNADPPSLNTGTSDDYLWLAAAIVDTTTASTLSAMPSNYVQVENEKSAASTSSVITAVARRQHTAQTEDPGEFTNSSRNWIAYTIAVPPVAGDIDPPGPPSAVRPVDAFGYDNEVELSWTAPVDDGGGTISGYRIEVSTNDGASWSTHVADTESTSTTAVLTGLTSGTRYLFRVAAINEEGVGDTAVSEWGATPIPDAEPQPSTATQSQTSAPWHLARIDQRDLPVGSVYNYRWTGDGIIVYVVDTGVRATHNQFSGITIETGFSVGATPATTDVVGHGTGVASIVAGSTLGAAKGVTIVPVKVYQDDHDIGNPLPVHADLMDGLEWIEANHPEGAPGIINLSMPIGTFDTADEIEASAKLTDLIDMGLLVVSALGNQSGTPSIYPRSQPAHVLVAGTNDSDAVWSGSSTGPMVDLFAPAQDVTWATNGSDSSTATTSGMSLAAPCVTGAAAMWLEANPDLTPRQLHDLILAWSTKGAVSGSLNGSPNRFLYTLAEIPAGEVTVTATISEQLPALVEGTSTQITATVEVADTLPPLVEATTVVSSATVLVAETLPVMTEAAAGVVVATAHAAEPLPPLGETATVDMSVDLEPAEQLPALSEAATVNTGDDTAVVLAETLPTLAESTTTTATASAAVADALPTLAESVAAAVDAQPQATLAEHLPPLGESLTGATSLTAVAAETLPALGETSTITLIVAVSTTEQLPAFTSISDIVATITATPAETLPVLGEALTVEVAPLDVDAALSELLPALVEAVAATSGAVLATPGPTASADIWTSASADTRTTGHADIWTRTTAEAHGRHR